MAVEIKEIVISAVLTNRASNKPPAPPVNTDAIVQQCVDQVVKILKQKNRR